MADKQISFRVSDEVYSHLVEISRLCNSTQKAYLTGLIESEWDRLQGNPKMKEMLNQLEQMSKLMRDMGIEKGV